METDFVPEMKHRFLFMYFPQGRPVPSVYNQWLICHQSDFHIFWVCPGISVLACIIWKWCPVSLVTEMQIKPFPISHIRQIKASKSGGCSCKPGSIVAGIMLTKPSEKNLTTPSLIWTLCPGNLSPKCVPQKSSCSLTLWCIPQSTANSGVKQLDKQLQPRPASWPSLSYEC